MTTETKDLPLLPEPNSYCTHADSHEYDVFTADQMHAYAIEAIRASATSAPSQTDAGNVMQPLSDEQIDAINIRDGAPFDDADFEALCREHGVWGTAESALCAVIWRAAIKAKDATP